MEPAKIDWGSIESVFIRDDTYEKINAPQWTDLLNSDDDSVDDETWFCRSDCKHPKTAEDYLRSTKLLRSASVSKLIGLGDWNWNWNREVENLKRRIGGQSAKESLSNNEENQNPNLATPNRPPLHLGKAKSSAEKEEGKDNCAEESTMLRAEESRRLKSTLSAKDLFGGRDILLGKITNLCNEIKRMATVVRTKEEKEEEEEDDQKTELVSAVMKKTPIEVGLRTENLSNYEVRPKKSMMMKTHTENTVPSLDLKSKTINTGSDQIIRTSPPTPQGFSSSKMKPPNNNHNSKSSRLKEREPFKELALKQHTPQRKSKEENAAQNSKLKNPASHDDPSDFETSTEGGRSLDIFWLFKPCALSS